jgi:hypothetical protein
LSEFIEATLPSKPDDLLMKEILRRSYTVPNSGAAYAFFLLGSFPITEFFLELKFE